jgi:hypothetical protein
MRWDLAPELKKQAVAMTKQKATEADHARKELINTRSMDALTKFNQGGLSAIPGPDMAWLNRRNPEFVTSLYDKANTRYRQSKSDDAEQRREQREANELALRTYMSTPKEERAGLNVDLEYGTTGANHLGLLAIKERQQKDKADVQKGEGVKESDFITDGLAQGFGLVVKPGDGKKTAEKKKTEYRAALQEAYFDFADSNKRLPNAAEKQQIIDGLLQKHVEARSLNPFSSEPFGLSDHEELGYQQATRLRAEGIRPPTPAASAPAVAQPSARRPVKYRVSPDGKQRAPVYADGTVGPIESAPK